MAEELGSFELLTSGGASLFQSEALRASVPPSDFSVARPRNIVVYLSLPDPSVASYHERSFARWHHSLDHLAFSPGRCVTPLD